MKKIKIINGKRQIVNVPNAYGNIAFGYEHFEDKHKKDGFFAIVIPIISENQEIDYTLENGIIDEEKGTFTYAIKEKVLPTLEELRNQRLTEANQVFDEYRRILMEASIEALVMNEVTPELRQLTNTLRQVKKRVLADLQTLDFEGLQKFTFQTEEAEQLRMAIESFKV